MPELSIACLTCRSKKAKCNITAEDYQAGLPCSKCRREMRPCTFTTERHNSRRQNRRSMSQNNSDTITMPDGSINMTLDLDNLDRSTAKPDDSRESNAGPGNAERTDSMVTAVVSNGNDALNLLFEAAQREERDVNSVRGGAGIDQASPLLTLSPTSPSAKSRTNLLPVLSSEQLEIWNAYRFVRMGWLSAEEIVWLLNMFFWNIAPLSPILDEFYADPANHYLLVTQEPVLTCIMLTISSRYHTIPTIGGQSRGYLIHQRLWDHFQHLLMRLVLGQEKISKAKTRTLGTIEALLLLTEWHPRALYVSPPASDGWDSDVLFTAKDRRDQGTELVDSPSRTRWREDVIEPANRSDRMCWMVISCALSLGNELGLFDEPQSKTANKGNTEEHEERTRQRRLWLSKLIYVYQEQLASRLGRRSMMSSSISHAVLYTENIDGTGNHSSRPWVSYVTAWTRLTKIVRSISDLLVPSAAATSQIIRSGRYISMIEHIQGLLSTWLKDHQSILSDGSHRADLLTLEYQSTRMHTFSLGLQAIVSRTAAEPNPSEPASFLLTPTDFSHVQEVIDSALMALRIAIRLYTKNVLVFCSIRTFLHVTVASVFLLKGLGLGVSPAKLRNSLDVLQRVVVALKNSNPDDLHFGGRYATLLEMHMARLQEHFVPSLRPHDITPPDLDQGNTAPGLADGDQFDFLGNINLTGEEIDADWLSLPLDMSLVPFGLDNFQGLQCLGDDTLDFLWNLGV
ncbi:C6 transcription factor-like protein [Paraphoma chrysanthemicola]|nr:C6 transcription factor-like protein [Paraphoma chrysanthemicola]